mgnify:CR=1 FL=1
MKRKQKYRNELKLVVVKPTKGVDWTGMIGYSKDAKGVDNPKGLGFEVLWEASNKVLRVYTTDKYRYLNVKQTTQLLGLIVRAMERTVKAELKK